MSLHTDDFPRPMGASTRFVTKCLKCGDTISVQFRPWHEYRMPVVVSSGLCVECAAELERSVA